MKNNMLKLNKLVFQTLVFVSFIAIFSSCGKEAIKYRLKNENYTVECLKCGEAVVIQTPSPQTLYKSKIRISFEVEKGDMGKINEGSYVNVSYKHPDGTSGSAHINYADLKVEGKTISFLQEWIWQTAAFITVEARLYNDKEQKSEVAKVYVYKPDGAD